jgi:hypothetical protein
MKKADKPANRGRYPEWTPKMIKALQDLGHESGSSPYSWYARAEPLPLSKASRFIRWYIPTTVGSRSICRRQKSRRSRVGRTSWVSASATGFSSARASSIRTASPATGLTNGDP